MIGGAAKQYPSIKTSIMNKLVISMALALLGTAGAYAQGTTTTSTTSNSGDQHCLAQADDRTWSSLGLNEDQVF